MATNLALQRFNQAIQNEGTQNYLNTVLKENKQDFVTALVSLVGNNEMLQQSEPMSTLYAAMKAAALNLPFDPNLGFAYCIPYKDNKSGKTLAQFQLGAKGLAQLAIRTNQFKHLHVTEIYEGQYKGKDIRTGKVKLNEEIDILPTTPVIGYLGYFQLLNGYEYEIYWDKAKMMAHAQRFSKSVNYGPWKTDFDAMAKKTILKQLLRQGNAPLTIEMQKAMEADQSVIRVNENGEEKIDYIDNPNNDIAEAEVVEEKPTKSTRDKLMEQASGEFVNEKKENNEAKATLF